MLNIADNLLFLIYFLYFGIFE